MNKRDVTDWKNNPVTIAIIKDINEAVQEVRERSPIKDTADQTAMQVCRDEGFIEGVQAILEALDDMGGDEDE